MSQEFAKGLGIGSAGLFTLKLLVFQGPNLHYLSYLCYAKGIIV